MTCSKHCTHQPCPNLHSCGIGHLSPLPVIDESLFIVNVPYGEQKSSNICAGTITKGPLVGRYVAGQPMPSADDMTYSGPFNGRGIPLYQANSDGSDPHEGAFDWINTILRNALSLLAIWMMLMVVCGAAGYFVARLNF